MSVEVSKPAPARGGRRQGAGRPALPEGEKVVAHTIYIKAETSRKLSALEKKWKDRGEWLLGGTIEELFDSLCQQ